MAASSPVPAPADGPDVASVPLRIAVLFLPREAVDIGPVDANEAAVRFLFFLVVLDTPTPLPPPQKPRLVVFRLGRCAIILFVCEVSSFWGWGLGEILLSQVASRSEITARHGQVFLARDWDGAGVSLRQIRSNIWEMKFLRAHKESNIKQRQAHEGEGGGDLVRRKCGVLARHCGDSPNRCGTGS